MATFISYELQMKAAENCSVSFTF